MKRRILTFTLAIVLSLSVVLPAQALRYQERLPNNIWPVLTPYTDALDANDSAGIAYHGERVIEYWLGGATAEHRASEWILNVVEHGQEISTIWTTSRIVAEHYETLGDIDRAVRAYRIALAFAEPYRALIINEPRLAGDPAEMDFARTLIENKLNTYDAAVDVYAEVRGEAGAVFHGARHEPRSGVYFGEPPGDAAVKDAPKQPSGTLIYVMYETEDMEQRVEHDLLQNETMHGYSRRDYSVIQIAWNFLHEGNSLRSVLNDTAKITAAARYLSSLNIPILLRIGAEMNVWDHAADPAEFIAAYRFIAEIMRREARNVALVWSVNYISSHGLTFDTFYPGDDVVDWVGVSLYTSRYFLGNPNTTDEQAAIYGTGPYANPVRYMQELVDLYGARKPIMVSEGGVSLRNNTSGEDLTQWALPRIRQMYAYIPMLFPQVKAMYWFNVPRPQEPQSFAFSSSPAARALYGQLTSSENFLGRGQTESPISYIRLGEATLPANTVTLLTYAPFFTMDNIMVQYRIDGRWIGQSQEIPYRSVLDLSGEADGAYTLSATVLSGEQVLRTVEYSLVKSGANVTVSSGTVTPPSPPPPPETLTVNPTSSTVYVNGAATVFEAYLINDNNFFKLRDLAYAINGSGKQFAVEWDGENNAIRLTSGQPYTPAGGELAPGDGTAKPADPTTARVFLDGRELDLTAYNIGGNNFFRLRDLMRELDIGVTWDGATSTIGIDASIGYAD